MTEPTLAMILRQAVSLCGTSEGAVRLSKADEAERARAAVRASRGMRSS